jgi:hypothetical protein
MTTPGRWRDWIEFAGWCVIPAVCISALSFVFGGFHGGASLLWNLAYSYLFSVEIGGLAWWTMPLLSARLCAVHPVLKWTGLIATLTAVAAVGTLFAIALIQVITALGISGGPFAGGEPFWQVYAGALRTAVPITLFIGIITTVIETAKARLRATELELRTQQLHREQAEKLAAEAQFASLSSRVQPHFLFNTLNSIAALIRENPRQAEQMVERLGSLLRGSLDAAETVPLEQEMKLVADYLEIQRARLGGRLRYEIDWRPESANGATVPPFAVQTVVENALKHVAGRRTEGVALKVRATTRENLLEVEVTDDGPGFDATALKAGHGLDNLQQRLRAIYGAAAGIDLDRGAGGMIVRLRVPSA